MKKSKFIIVFAIIIVIGAYIFNNFRSDVNITQYVKKVDQIPQQFYDSRLEEKIAPGGYINGYVRKVTDGDTIQVEYNGNVYKVRLLDIDTPESVKSGVPVQAYAKEASQFTKEMTLNKTIKLFFEKGLKDKYDRLLAHIILKDGEYLNALLVRNGYARVEVLSPNTEFKFYFDQLEQKAVSEKVGLWGLKKDEIPFVWSSSGYYIPRYWNN